MTGKTPSICQRSNTTSNARITPASGVSNRHSMAAATPAAKECGTRQGPGPAAAPTRPHPGPGAIRPSWPTLWRTPSSPPPRPIAAASLRNGICPWWFIVLGLSHGPRSVGEPGAPPSGTAAMAPPRPVPGLGSGSGCSAAQNYPAQCPAVGRTASQSPRETPAHTGSR